MPFKLGYTMWSDKQTVQFNGGPYVLGHIQTGAPDKLAVVVRVVSGHLNYGGVTYSNGQCFAAASHSGQIAVSGSGPTSMEVQFGIT